MSLRKLGARKRWPLVMVVAMFFSGVAPAFLPQSTVNAQTAPVGQGFIINAGDLRFIYEQILVAQDHAAGGTLFGTGPNQVSDPQLPRGLRTVDGSFNNLVPGQTNFGRADLVFPRMLVPNYRSAETVVVAAPGQPVGTPTSYAQKSGTVSDSQPRTVSNLIVDQTEQNPAAVAAADNPCGAGGFVCGGTAALDPV